MPQRYEKPLIMDGLPIKIDIKDIDQMDNDEYIMARRNSFGASDSSILLGVNPYQGIEELVRSKLLTEVTEEEREVGEKSAVKKGRELEPLIIDKAAVALDIDIIKPTDMYRFIDYPQLTINFDGVTDTPEQYIPVEIKVVTRFGEKHYDFSKAFYRDSNPIKMPYVPKPTVEWQKLTSIENKAAYYGIPPYYYTQVNQQMLGLDAKEGYLAVLLDNSWELVIFHIYRDQPMLDRLIAVSEYQWQRIEAAKNTQEL